MYCNKSPIKLERYILIALFQTDMEFTMDPFDEILDRTLFSRCYESIRQELPHVPIRVLALERQDIDEDFLKKMGISLIRIKTAPKTELFSKSANFIPGKLLWEPIPGDSPDSVYIITSPFTTSIPAGFWSGGLEIFCGSNERPVLSISDVKVHPCNLFFKIVTDAEKEEFITHVFQYKDEWYYDDEIGERRDAKTHRILNRSQDFPHVYEADGALLIAKSRDLYALASFADAGEIVPYNPSKENDFVTIRSPLDVVQLCEYELRTRSPLSYSCNSSPVNRSIGSAHPEMKFGRETVSRSEMSNFSQVSGNQGIARRRTTVRRTNNPAD